jgi:Calcium binding
MAREDEARDRRITMEIVVDAYTEDERVTGWYCYLEET